MTAPATNSKPASASPSGRYQRSARNYLIDAGFQLKYTAYLVAIAIVLSGSLGALLANASNEVIAQSRQMVEQGQDIVARGQEVVGESRKVSAVVQMNIVRDPDYKEHPELAEAFAEGSRAQDKRLADQQKRLETQAVQLKQRAADLATQQARATLLLAVALTLLVLGIGLAGIMVTHRVAGPIFKMKRLLRHVGEGHLVLREKLRKGDELQHFFEAFEGMVESLRARQAAEIAKLDTAIARLEREAGAVDLDELRELRREMVDALES